MTTPSDSAAHAKRCGPLPGGLFGRHVRENLQTQEGRMGWLEAQKEVEDLTKLFFFTRIRETLWNLGIGPKPPWIARYAPVCACNGMTFSDLASDIRLIAKEDG